MPFGRLVCALALAGLGVLSLLYRDFAVIWQPVPQSLPWREALALLSGVVMLASGMGLLFERTAKASTLVLAAYLLLAWVLPQALKAVPDGTGFVGRWLGFFETLTPLCACVLLLCAPGQPIHRAGVQIAGRVALATRIVFGLACGVFGLSHFLYAGFTAGMIPDWIPARLAWACITGAGHAAAGLALLVGVLPGLAATLEALMMACFVLLVHLPAVVLRPAPAWAPTERIQWTALCWASLLAGSVWVIASALRQQQVARAHGTSTPAGPSPFPRQPENTRKTTP